MRVKDLIVRFGENFKLDTMKLNDTTLPNLKGTNPVPIEDIVNNHQNVESLRDEDKLDLSLAEMEKEEFESIVLACNSYLTFNNNSIPSPQLTISEIGFDLFKDFLTEAAGKRNGTERYMTALSITLAATGDVITPIYQSVYLKWIRYDVSTQKNLYEIPNLGYGEFYKFHQGQFVKIPTKAERDTLIENYRQGIKLIHKNGETLQDFRPNTDVESILIPLQVIYTVMHNAHPSNLFISNAVRDVQYDSNSPIKHIVGVSGFRVPIAGKPVLYADRSHLCPPCTASFGFDLA